MYDNVNFQIITIQLIALPTNNRIFLENIPTETIKRKPIIAMQKFKFVGVMQKQSNSSGTFWEQ